jgi:hypothetical protein
MIIDIPIVKEKDNNILVTSSVDKNLLWFELNKNYKNWITSSSDPFLIGLILPAMKTGEEIVVKGKISKDLFFNLSTNFQHVILHLFPFLKPVRIICENDFYNSSKKENYIVTGFSGGVDSYCTLNDYYFNNNVDDYKITHLLFNQVGAHGTSQEVFLKKYQVLKTITDQIKLPFILVNSNLRDFYTDLSFKQTHTIRNAVVPHLLEPMIYRFLYSSGFNYRDMALFNKDDSSYADPVLLPLLSTSQLSLVSVGSEYTRVEKTKKVANIKITHTTLDVCLDNKRKNFSLNCSVCSKCLRTMLTLDLSNNLEKYASVFDLEKYNSLKNNYTASLAKDNPLELEILEYTTDLFK